MVWTKKKPTYSVAQPFSSKTPNFIGARGTHVAAAKVCS